MCLSGCEVFVEDFIEKTKTCTWYKILELINLNLPSGGQNVDADNLKFCAFLLMLWPHSYIGHRHYKKNFKHEFSLLRFVLD